MINSTMQEYVIDVSLLHILHSGVIYFHLYFHICRSVCMYAKLHIYTPKCIPICQL